MANGMVTNPQGLPIIQVGDFVYREWRKGAVVRYEPYLVICVDDRKICVQKLGENYAWSLEKHSMLVKGRGSTRDWGASLQFVLYLPAAYRMTLVEEFPADDPEVVLGLSGDYSEAEIQTAYRKKCKETHPDRWGAEDAFRRVQAAREKLLQQLKIASKP